MGFRVQRPCLEGLGEKKVWRMDSSIWGTVAGRAKMKAGVEGKEAAGLKRQTALKWGWHPGTGMICSADQRVNQKCMMRVDCSVETVRGLTVCEKAAFPLVETAGGGGVVC